MVLYEHPDHCIERLATERERIERRLEMVLSGR